MEPFHFNSDRRRGKTKRKILIGLIIILAAGFASLFALEKNVEPAPILTEIQPESNESRDPVARDSASDRDNAQPEENPAESKNENPVSEKITVSEPKQTLENKPAETPATKPVEKPVAVSNSPTPAPIQPPDQVQEESSKPVQSSIIDLINAERVKAGLSVLKENNLLDQGALAKSRDMAEKNYFSHTTSEGKTDFDFMTEAGYKFSAAGSNIAKGYYESDQALVDAWMASPGHRANILADFAVDFGFGEYNNYFTMFVTKPL